MIGGVSGVGMSSDRGSGMSVVGLLGQSLSNIRAGERGAEGSPGLSFSNSGAGGRGKSSGSMSWGSSEGATSFTWVKK